MAYAPVNRIMLGAVAPVLIYYAGRKLDMALAGAIAAAVWCLLLMGYHLAARRELDGFSSIGAAYGVSELAGLLVTRNPDWYLLSPVVSDAVLGTVFLLTMALPKSLIQILSEQSAGLDAFPDDIRNSIHYRPLWLRLSLAWGGVYLLKAALKWGVLTHFSVETYLTARVVLDWPVIIGMMAFSFWYPKRYWQRVFSPTN